MRSQSGECLTCAPRSWEYPPRGSIIASCGHRLTDDEGTGEILTSWDWDDGDMVESSGCYCTWCAIHEKVSGRLIECWVYEEHREAA